MIAITYKVSSSRNAKVQNRKVVIFQGVSGNANPFFICTKNVQSIVIKERRVRIMYKPCTKSNKDQFVGRSGSNWK